MALRTKDIAATASWTPCDPGQVHAKPAEDHDHLTEINLASAGAEQEWDGAPAQQNPRLQAFGTSCPGSRGRSCTRSLRGLTADELAEPQVEKIRLGETS